MMESNISTINFCNLWFQPWWNQTWVLLVFITCGYQHGEISYEHYWYLSTMIFTMTELIVEITDIYPQWFPT